VSIRVLLADDQAMVRAGFRMTQEPYASAKRVFWIVDNGSSHRGQAAIDRLAARYPNAVMVHTPVHASWTNQIPVNRPSARRHARAG
jgi:DNA-binding NarL/FixJ family response regulator